MFRNALVTIGLLWFSLAPTLCAAGVLSHACDSPINFKYETCCVNIEHDCFEHGRSHDGCSHDNGSHDACANDPCQGQVVVEKVRDEGFQCSNHDALGGLDSVIDGQRSPWCWQKTSLSPLRHAPSRLISRSVPTAIFVCAFR